MAERVKRRLTAARLSVSLAVAALLGGLAARDNGAEARAHDAVDGKRAVPANSIGSAQVKDHSLLYRDIKMNEVYSIKMVNDRFYKIRDTSPVATVQVVSPADGVLATLDASAIPQPGAGVGFAAHAIVINYRPPAG
jgi:hypothetical protein